jgi:hypothetical protein
VVNAEGCDLSKRYLEASLPARPAHHALWMVFELVLGSQGEPKMAPLFSGILDHGCYYAAITLFDPVGCRRILWGKNSSRDFQTNVLANKDLWYPRLDT